MTNALDQLDNVAGNLYARKIFDLDTRCKEEVEAILADWAERHLFGSGPMIKQCLEAYLRAAELHLNAVVDSHVEAASNQQLHFSEAADHAKNRLEETAAQQKEKVRRQADDILKRCHNPPAAVIAWVGQTIDERLGKLVEHNARRIEIESMRKGAHVTSSEPPELLEACKKFAAKHQAPSLCGFVMMGIKGKANKDPILKAIKEVCSKRGIQAVRADEKRFNGDLWNNVRTYMHGAGFGIAVIQASDSKNTRHNVAIEMGYMLALKKEVCILKERALRKMPADLVGKLYDEFDKKKPVRSIRNVLDTWLKDSDLGEEKPPPPAK